jgi:tRNA/rRNA methyltransferase
MTFHAFVLRRPDGSYLTGHSDDPEQVLARQRDGAAPGAAVATLEWTQAFATRDEAEAAQRQVQGWSNAKKQALFAQGWAAMTDGNAPGRAGVERTATGDAVPESATFERPAAVAGGDRSAVPPPAIVLVRPQLGENIGKAARAMLNFGLTELRLVAPRDGWPNPAAGPAASGADEVLRHARVFDSVAAATEDCVHVYATTVRKRGVTKPVVTPEIAARTIHAAAGQSAILFGPERSGLETDDVAVARTIVTVPINPAFGSLNLAQAVILVAYEWSRYVALASPPETALAPPAPQGELDGMIAQLDAMLVDAGFFFPPDRAPTVRRTLRTLLTKPAWNSMEVRTLRGVLSALAGKRPREG